MRNTWPKIGRRKGIPRQRVVPSKDIDVRESGWYQHAAPWKQAEYLRQETEGRRKK